MMTGISGAVGGSTVVVEPCLPALPFGTVHIGSVDCIY